MVPLVMLPLMPFNTRLLIVIYSNFIKKFIDAGN